MLGRASGRLSVDPVLALAPAIALAAVTVLPLRVLPALARLADRLAARTTRFGVAMTSWQLSRRATRQSAPMLLVVLAVGAGTLALAQHQSWRRSAADQAAFAAGADIRADLIFPLPLGRGAAVARAGHVRAAMAVTTSLTTASGSQILALDAPRAAGTALLRADEAGARPAVLWRRLAPPPVRAVPLPGRPARLELTASMRPGPGPGIAPVHVSVSLQDGAGIAYTVPAGVLPDDGRPHQLMALLSASRQARYPLRLLAVTAGYTLPPVPKNRHNGVAGGRVAQFDLRGLAVSGAVSGPFAAPFADGAALAGWRPAVSSADLALSGVGIPPELAANPGAAGPGTTAFHPGYGQTSLYAPPLRPPLYPVYGQLVLTAPAPQVIPAIATRAFLGSNHIGIGSLFQVSAPGPATITARVVASVPSFPTITGSGGALIIDQAAAQEVLIAQHAPAARGDPVVAGHRGRPGSPRAAARHRAHQPGQAGLGLALRSDVGDSAAGRARGRGRGRAAGDPGILGQRGGQRARAARPGRAAERARRRRRYPGAVAVPGGTRAERAGRRDRAAARASRSRTCSCRP